MGEGKIVTIHSYRGGTGKSNITANLAACAHEAGKRVAVLDTDLQSPGIHILFNFDQEKVKLTLYDFLRGKCDIGQVAYDVSERCGPKSSGKIWLVPAALNAQAITQLLEEGYDIQRLNANFDELLDEFDLDYLLIDTHPGLNKETMLAAALSDILVILVRPDQQDYYGTAVLTEIARKLEVPRVYLIANKVSTRLDSKAVKARFKEVFGHEVIAAIPLSEDFAELASEGLFVRRYPEHEISRIVRGIAQEIFSA
jgi:septum site-determining protein MinD